MPANPANRKHLATVPGTMPGVNFNVVLNTTEGKEVVEFYDVRFPHCEFGQFVSCYYAETLLGCRSGLDLDGGITDWKVSAEGMALVREALLLY
jgi:hypothetical protein